ncbi:DUF185-domain-containing protein [Leucogyrophana mollusca]|uniref:DUF185-domain-containing protein n=1 Tax=Leucogyrophana mollusca TaxID=85980 RepID=A0ACB8BKI7_9AGAM|nr:DUF185-domain-containing protein [Leucogyrophana mollusca]
MLRLASKSQLNGCRRRPASFTWFRAARNHTAPQKRTYSVNNGLGTITEVEKIITDSIKATGPISFSTYMQLCLSHPIHGYYMKPEHAVFGTQGDFITSPEISQVFGELLAAWMLERWMKSAHLKPFRLIELGPGRGTLMDDILRVISQFKNLRDKLGSVHLVETSTAMREMQQNKLYTASQNLGCNIVWHDSVEDIPHDEEQYTMLVAHEFFDALPVHVLEKTNQGWHEVLIALAENPSITYTMPSSPSPPPALADLNREPCSSRWKRVLSPSPTASSTVLGLISPRFKTVPVGTRIEVSAASTRTARQIGELLASGGGCALVVDYGKDHVFGDSLRAFKNHEIVDIFNLPGECDITANVDFALLKEALGNIVATHGTISQADFLTRLGLRLRVDALKRAASTDQRKGAIEEGAKRLIDPVGMGTQYRVLGITSRATGEGQEVWPFMEALGQENVSDPVA